MWFGVSPRLRVSLLVGLASLAAAGVTVGATLLATEERRNAAAPPRTGSPPLILDLGVRLDPEAKALRRAASLYDRGNRAAAAALFQRYRSVESELGSAFATWPAGFADIQRIATEHPGSGAAQLHLGLALYWLGRTAEAEASWRNAKRVEPDASYALRAADLLHPEYPVPGVPIFVPSFPAPPAVARLSPPRQLMLLEAQAAGGGVRERLLYGVALQRLGRQRSAANEFAAAARIAPGDPEAQTAAAVGRFDKDAPARAFSRLGPLAREFPKSTTVRYHLGLMLLWLGRVDEAKRQLVLARVAGHDTRLGREAARLLARLESAEGSTAQP
jgi:tetratricopeptide (TPR) repeat protein